MTGGGGDGGDGGGKGRAGREEGQVVEGASRGHEADIIYLPS
jgi:hypothetical protein